MIKITRETALEFLSKIRDEIDNDVKLSKLCKVKIESNVERTEFETYYQGASNGFIAELINALTGYEVEVLGDYEKLFPCPCCGFRTLTELYDINEGTGYDICPYCKWEDDGTIEQHIYSSVNKGTLKDYRNKIQQNYNKFYINKWKLE